MTKFLNDINLSAGNDIQFKTTAGVNAGKIEQDGNNLVLSNAVGDVLLGDGSSDIFIGDGTNNVDIIFEQSGAIKGDGSAVTLTLGGANTTLNLENPNISGSLSIGATTINNKLTFTTTNGFILFDYEPSGDTGEYTTEVPLIKVGIGTGETTILARISEYRGVVLGADDTVWLQAGDTKSVIKSNVGLTTEQVLMSAEGGFHAYGFPGNDTSWANRVEFKFRADSTTASENGLYIGDGGYTQFIDLSRNLKNIGTISSGAITSSSRITSTKTSTHVSGNITDANAHLDLYNSWTSNTDQKGSIITFTDNYYDGSNYHKTTRAAIKGGTDTIGNTADGYLEFYTDSGGGNSPTLALRLDKDQNSTFSGNIAVVKGSATVKVEESGGADVRMVAGGSTGYIGNYSNDQLNIMQNGASAITIDTSKNSTFTGDVALADGKAVKLGSGGTFQLWHQSGTNGNSFIDEQSTGELFIRSNSIIRLAHYANNTYSATFNPAGAVELYYNTAKKFETHSAGVTATGDVVATDGSDTATLKFSGLVLSRSNSYIQSNADNSDTLNIGQSSVRWGHVKLDAADFAVFNGGTERFKINSSGVASFSGNITAGTNSITASQYYVQGTYPRIYLSDTNSDDDYSIINDNGTFVVYNDTDSSTAFAIAGNNNVTFAGTVTANGTTLTGNQDISGIATNATAISNITEFPGFGTSSTTALRGDTTIPSVAGLASTSYVDTAVANIVNSAPAALNTLDELAEALGDDANFSTTITTSIGTKMAKAGGTFTGAITMGGDTNMNGHSIFENSENTHSIDLSDHSGYTWLRNQYNGWVFQGGTAGDDWTQSVRLTLEATDSSNNNKWVILGQQNANQTEGKYKGVRVVKYNSGTQDGDFQAGTATFTGAVSLTGGALSISGDGSNAVTFTESGSGDFTIDAPDDIRLDAGGGDRVLKDDGTEFGRLSNASGDLIIQSTTSNADIRFQGNDTGTTITPLAFDISDNGAATFSGALTFTDGGITTAANYFQLNTPSGYIQIGAMNGSHAHIYTDRPSFYTNKPILVSGATVLTTSSGVSISGAQTISGNKTFAGIPVFENATYWQVSGTDYAVQRADARDDSTTEARLHWYGNDASGGTTNFKHAYYDGGSYINVTAASGQLRIGGELEADGLDINGNADISGTLNVSSNITTNHVLPVTDSTYNVGSSSVRYANGYFDNVHGDGSNLTNVSATDSTKLPLAGGTMSGDITMGNNDIIGVKFIQANGNVDIRTGSGEYALHAAQDGQVALYTNGVKKFETTSIGADVTGGTLGFSTAGDITFPDNSGAALEFKEGSNLYMRFITTNGGEAIQMEKATTISNSLQVNALTATTGDFNGNLAVEDEIHLTDGGSTIRGKLLLNSSDRDNVELRAESLGSTMKFFTVGTEALELDASQNANFAGDVKAQDKGFQAGAGGDKDGFVFHDLYTAGGNHWGYKAFTNNSNARLSIVTNGTEQLSINSSGNVGVGITSPVSTFHVYENSTETSQNAGITVENDGNGDATVQFLLTGIRRWATGIDHSDSDKFKIASSGDLGSDAKFTLDTSGNATFAGTVEASSYKISSTTILQGSTNVTLGSAGGTGTISLTTHTSTPFKIENDDTITISSDTTFGGNAFGGTYLGVGANGVTQWGASRGIMTWGSGYASIYASGSNELWLGASGASDKSIVLDGSTVTINCNADISGHLSVDTVTASTIDTDKFVVIDSGNRFYYRTGAEVRSDIGAGTSNFDGAYASLSGKPTIPSGNQIIDWTVDQGSTNIHTGNYNNTDTVDMGSGFIVANNGGTNQFTIVEDNALRFAGTGATTVAFNSTTKKVTIDSPAETYTAHESISQATSNLNNSGRTYIQDITLDSNGHVTAVGVASESDQTSVSGSSGSCTGNAATATQATNTINCKTTSVSNSTDYFGVFVDSNGNGFQDLHVGAGLKYNPSSDILTAGKLTSDTVRIVEDAKSTGIDGTAGAGQACMTITGAGAGNESNITLKMVGTAHGSPVKIKMTAEDTEGNGAGNGMISYHPDTDTLGIGQTTTHNSMAMLIDNSDVVSFKNQATFTNGIDVTSGVNSTSKTTGTVKVAGGVGIVKTLNVGGDVVAYASSDKRYKDNLQAITNPIDKVKSLTGYTFTWNDKHEQFNGNNDIGVVAQEVEKVFPEIVDTRDDGYKAVKYEKMVAVLIEAVKDQQKQIDELKAIIDGSSK